VPRVEVSEAVGAERRAVYEIAKDMESYPTYMPNVKEVAVVERYDDGTLTSWDTVLEGRPFRWKERDVFDDDAMKITYRQTEGDLKKFEGEWRFEEVEGGTRVTLTVDFEIGIPMIAALLNPVARLKVRENCAMMLKGIKERAEAT